MGNPFLNMDNEESSNEQNPNEMNPHVVPMLNQITEELDSITNSANNYLRRGLNRVDTNLSMLENQLGLQQAIPAPPSPPPPISGPTKPYIPPCKWKVTMFGVQPGEAMLIAPANANIETLNETEADSGSVVIVYVDTQLEANQICNQAKLILGNKPGFQCIVSEHTGGAPCTPQTPQIVLNPLGPYNQNPPTPTQGTPTPTPIPPQSSPFNPNVIPPFNVPPPIGDKCCPEMKCPAPQVNVEVKPIVKVELDAQNVSLNCSIPPITIPPCPPPIVNVQVHNDVECKKEEDTEEDCQTKCEKEENEEKKKECLEKCPKGLQFKNHLEWMSEKNGIKQLEKYVALFGYPIEDINGDSMFDVLRNIESQMDKRMRIQPMFQTSIPKT